MNRWDKARKLSELIIFYGRGKIDKDMADLIAFRYYSNVSCFSRLNRHTSISALANNLALAEIMSEEDKEGSQS